MSASTGPAAGPQQTGRDALLVLCGLVAFGLYALVRVASTSPVTTIAALTVMTAAAAGAVIVRARVKDRLAARHDPPGKGIVIGTVRGDWRFARPRPYTLGWDSFLQHVLITGPTGRGKSFTFIDPIVRAHLRRPNTGVFYVDGKGDRVDQGENRMRFDRVFCPEDPASSARWNPLAGPDPSLAASGFADALFPAASLPNPVYYEVRGAYAVRVVAPAIAYAGYHVRSPPRMSAEQVHAALVAHGISAKKAEYLVSQRGVGVCEDQLRWLPSREEQGAEALCELIERRAQPRAAIDDALLMPASSEPTISALHHVLFTDGELEELAKALLARVEATMPPIVRDRFTQLATQIESLATLPAKERNAVLSNLENRLAPFLAPPFDRLCSRADFTLADVCRGKSVAFLLPAGRFPGLARPLGRIALAQFQQAVLADRTPGVRKVAVLDEFHNFVSPDFTAFLAQARSKGGGAVMCTQTITDFDIEYRDRLLANASTQIITPGAMPYDAEHWSRAFGEHETVERAETRPPRSILDPAPLPSVRTHTLTQPRYSPTAVSEIPEGRALIRQLQGRRAYPPVLVDVERHA